MKRVRKNIFAELEKVKNLIKTKFPELEVRNFCIFIGRIGQYHYNKKKKMPLGLEREVYDLLMENGFNPYTVYRWALLERVPDDIKYQLRQNQISLKNASRLFFKRNHETETSLQLEIKQQGLKLIEVM